MKLTEFSSTSIKMVGMYRFMIINGIYYDGMTDIVEPVGMRMSSNSHGLWEIIYSGIIPSRKTNHN